MFLSRIQTGFLDNSNRWVSIDKITKERGLTLDTRVKKSYRPPFTYSFRYVYVFKRWMLILKEDTFTRPYICQYTRFY